jgi:hypothetical protein
MIEQIYGPTLGMNTALAAGDEASKKRLKELHNRVVEHVRIDASLYGICWQALPVDFIPNLFFNFYFYIRLEHSRHRQILHTHYDEALDTVTGSARQGLRGVPVQAGCLQDDLCQD